ncbi:MAG: hypothetical protein IJ272_06635 [Clostridia bacterium]|nr:hypothetical protein [Clostridia bacterium]
MDILEKVYYTVQYSKDKNELLEIIRAMIPGAIETRNIVNNLESNPIYDAKLRLEVLCKIPDRYYTYEFVDWIIDSADDTELMKRLYQADVSRFGSFVAVNIKDPDEIERMYKEGSYKIQCAAVANNHSNREFLKRIIRECDDNYIKKIAQETLAVLTVKETTNPDEIEEMYGSGTYEVKLAAASNIHARCDFLERIVFDDNEFKTIREAALKTFEKISST